MGACGKEGVRGRLDAGILRIPGAVSIPVPTNLQRTAGILFVGTAGCVKLKIGVGVSRGWQNCQRSRGGCFIGCHKNIERRDIQLGHNNLVGERTITFRRGRHLETSGTMRHHIRPLGHAECSCRSIGLDACQGNGSTCHQIKHRSIHKTNQARHGLGDEQLIIACLTMLVVARRAYMDKIDAIGGGCPTEPLLLAYGTLVTGKIGHLLARCIIQGEHRV